MKKIKSAALSLALALVISACGVPAAAPSPTPADSPSPSPSPSPEPSAPAALEDYQAYIDKALALVDRTRRDDLSDVTCEFDEQYAYTGPAAAMMELYGQGEEYSEDDAELFNEVCDLVVENMPQDASAYDKYRYLAYFVSDCTDYDLTGKAGAMSLTPYGTIMGHSSVCLGYAYTYLYLCEKAGLWCRAIEGYSKHNNEQHAWNMVMLEDGTYYVDVTWCDSYSMFSSSWSANFMRTEDEFMQTHGVTEGEAATGIVIY